MLMEGGTIQDWAREHIFIGFEFEPMGTKKTIDKIFEERHVNENNLLELAKIEAEKMVNKRFLYFDNKNKKIYVFSKDKEGKYSWQPATSKDRLLNYFYRLLSD